MSQIRADNITNRQGTGAPIFVNGIRVTGLTSISNMVANTGTFSGAVSIGGTLTYEDVTNVDSVGLITARNGINVPAGGVTIGGKQITGDSQGIGIGTDNPASIFHIQDTGPVLTAKATNASSGLRVNVIGNTTGEIVRIQQDGSELLRIKHGGNIGINQSNPVTKLQLNGNYSENIVAVSGTAVDCSTGNYFTKTITGATTFTFTNVPSGVAYAFTFEVTLNGSNAITWPSSVKWPADTAPTITDGKTQVFVFLTDDGGTRWRGSSLVDYTN